MTSDTLFVECRFQLDELYTQFPDLVFVHFVRNPLDLAAAVGTNLKTLRSQVGDFKALHGGFGAAADKMLSRCEIMYPGIGPGGGQCALNHKELKRLSECWKYSCPTPSGAEQEPWGCLVSMLWAEINTLVHAFGKRCLSTTTRRYVIFHGEDVLGLRGMGTKSKLMNQLAEALHVDSGLVQTAFSNVSRASLLPTFGKFAQSESFIESNHRCAESAVTGVLRSFGYESSSGVGTYDFDAEIMSAQERKKQLGLKARLVSSPIMLTAVVLLLAAILVVFLNARATPVDSSSGATILRSLANSVQSLVTISMLTIFSLATLHLAYLTFQEYALPVLTGSN